MDVTVSIERAIGHRLLGHDGLCANLHGHNYMFELTVSGVPDKIGLVVDFADLKKELKDFLEPFNHAMVLTTGDPDFDAIRQTNKVVLFSVNPSAENFCSLVFNRFVDLGYSVKQVKVRESEDGWAMTDRVDRTVKVLARSA